MPTNLDSEGKVSYEEDKVPDARPIEPEGRKGGKPSLFKWLFFVVVVIYILLVYYHAPLLMFLGRYLVVTHEPEKSDLIVCLAGGNIERGLSAADAFKRGLAPRIFVGREELPDGYEVLKERGLNYPQTVDLMIMILTGLGVPRTAILVSDHPVKSTVDEAKAVRDIVKEKGYRSIIIITSPIHSRRAWLTFRKFLEDEGIRIFLLPASYSKFRPEEWWKERRFVREVIIEYEKLIYYTLKYLW
jgi:uncharacterized SAM-binding protein YcdF (DUF218 family)